MSILAKALYDNTAECADELAFQRGDIVTVMEQNVSGTSGWWMCSLHGRTGLAPANRLRLLPPTPAGPVVAAKRAGNQSIYQVPSLPRPISTPTYERMDMIYKVPSWPLTGPSSPVWSGQSCSMKTPETSKVSPVLPHVSLDPTYDTPVPVLQDVQQRHYSEFCTLPNPSKKDWIYDVPVCTEKPSTLKFSCDTLPISAVCRQLYDTPLPCAVSSQRINPASTLYDTPKSNLPTMPGPPKVLPPQRIYDTPSSANEEHDSKAVGHELKPFEFRSDSRDHPELKMVRLQRMRTFLACTTFHSFSDGANVPGQEDGPGQAVPASQRISTASSSSSSSCDSLSLSSSSPEPLREVALAHDEACQKLLALQESVCADVPQLMNFVSSNWRCKAHLEEHLEEIKAAMEKIVCSLQRFLSFALDTKGNARRLTDSNLQARLCKQLSVVEDSGVILQQTASDLSAAGWTLGSLCQDQGPVQTPDQLDRFVMVARTVPDDVKRLVSIICANAKLLFRVPPKDPDSENHPSLEQAKRSSENEREPEPEEDDSDYVQLQRVEEPKHEEQTAEQKDNLSPMSEKAPCKRTTSDPSSSSENHRTPSLSEHCRLYFGALQKAIRGFVDSLDHGQPPEKFISQSKLVIMVGQRLVDTLCREASRRGSCPGLLATSNHLCALLKQLAVATKKAAVHFPEKRSVQEAQEFAKELAQRAQHFRVTLDL